ncbi:MAG: GFA family protein [Cohaesibacteraceae bacterium]
MAYPKPNKGQWSGGCLCGSVRFHIDGAMSDLSACHCGQCRRQSGHYPVAALVAKADLTFERQETLRWYRSSQFAKRGFCGACGSFLFWDDGSEDMSLNIGSLDQPTGLSLASHIFVADKGDYYRITDGLPQAAAYE